MTAPSPVAAAASATSSAVDRPVRVVGRLGPAVLAGAALGAAAWASDQLAYPWSVLIPANGIAAWVAVAFVVGALGRGWLGGAIRGLVALLVGVAVYELLTGTVGYGVASGGAVHATLVWGAVSCAIGPVFGAAGATWRGASGRRRAIAVGLLAAAFIAEGVVFGGPRLVSGGDLLAIDPGALLLAGEVAIGLALPWILLRPDERRDGYLAMLVLAVAVAVAIGPAYVIIRTVADRF